MLAPVRLLTYGQQCRTEGGLDDADRDSRPIIEWYRRKTSHLREKFGPGPRIHFHVGVFDGIEPADEGDAESCRRRLVASQEALLRLAADVWDAPRSLSREVLDVGCGLGGGSIFWAAEHGASVTAVTDVPEHAALVAELARDAGVEARLQALVADACAIKSHMRFNAAVAVESSCYLPRRTWFMHLSGLLQKGGHVCIEDSFSDDPSFAGRFDAYWRTRIGTRREYISAAVEAGFTLDRDEDITERVVEFWRQGVVYMELVRRRGLVDEAEQRRLARSIEWQSDCIQAWQERRVETRLLRFRVGAC